MTTINITTALVLRYKPRSTTYRICYHNVQIKQNTCILDTMVSKLASVLPFIEPKPSWLWGCVYEDQSSGKIYTRPYEMFDMDKWEIIS